MTRGFVEKGDYFEVMGRKPAADLVLASERKLAKIIIEPEFVDGIFVAIHAAVEKRRSSGLSIDPTIREEVTGIVGAAMGGNDHLVQMRSTLNRYVIGITQTDAHTLDIARNNYSAEVMK